ncbi:transposase [Rhodococcus globerulus]|uniref:transposase n=1 Tax=Rhodococcus globerulus TaxID=33008 RepID=UPI00374EAEA2
MSRSRFHAIGKGRSSRRSPLKRQRRLSGVDEIVLSLYAKGLTTGEISAHFAEIFPRKREGPRGIGLERDHLADH